MPRQPGPNVTIKVAEAATSKQHRMLRCHVAGELQNEEQICCLLLHSKLSK
jgi:hypothetical protein